MNINQKSTNLVPYPSLYTNFNKYDFYSYFYYCFDDNFLLTLNSHILTKDILLMRQRADNCESYQPSLVLRDSEAASDFFHLRHSTVISFFIDNMVDVPVCFKKSKSLYGVGFELQPSRFINFITRHGKKEQVFKFFNLALNRLFCEHKDLLFVDKYLGSWSLIYTIFSKIYTLHKPFPHSLSPASATEPLNTSFLSHTFNINHPLSYGRSIYYDNNIYVNPLHFTRNLFFNLVRKYAPLFTFYVRKVDKKIRKHSRGKSGKYLIVWKYIPEYKRFYISLRLFLKDLKLSRERVFVERIFRTLFNLFSNPNQTFLAKVRKFSHVFVFQNFRKTLMTTLRAAS